MNGQITVSRNELLNKLTAVGKVVSNKSLIPCHDNFLFEINDGVLSVTGADREGNITKTIECVSQSMENCKFQIEHKIMLDGLKVLPEQPLIIDVEIKGSSGNATLKHESGIYRIPVISNDDFSVIQQKAGETIRPITLESHVLVDGIKKVIGFAGHDELRPIMNSVLMESKEGKLTFTSTNSNMMGIYEVFNTDLDDFNIVLPLKFGKIISELADGIDTIELQIGSRNLTAMFGDTKIVYRLIEGNYPNFRAVIPRDNDKEVKADVKSFNGALKRTSIFANKSSLLVSLSISDQNLTVSGKDDDFQMSAQEQMSVEYSSTELIEIGFKSEFLLQCLNAIDTPEVRITMRESNTAALISPVYDEGDEYHSLTILIMPMMIAV
jgi:DNA polymerase-3 subunit beta